MLTMETLRALCLDETIMLTQHLHLRMRERGIKYWEIIQAVREGEIIEQYESDFPYPSCLINCVSLHVVCSVGNGILYIITAYRPSADKWEDDGKTRKEQQT